MFFIMFSKWKIRGINELLVTIVVIYEYIKWANGANGRPLACVETTEAIILLLLSGVEVILVNNTAHSRILYAVEEEGYGYVLQTKWVDYCHRIVC